MEVNAGGGGIFPDFLHNLTGILSAKHQIQILANKMQGFGNFFCIIHVILMLNNFTCQVTDFKNKAATADKLAFLPLVKRQVFCIGDSLDRLKMEKHKAQVHPTAQEVTANLEPETLPPSLPCSLAPLLSCSLSSCFLPRYLAT